VYSVVTFASVFQTRLHVKAIRYHAVSAHRIPYLNMVCQGDVSTMAEPTMRRGHNELGVSHTIEQVSEAVQGMLMIIEAESDSTD
jgi:hypothetical protein